MIEDNKKNKTNKTNKKAITLSPKEKAFCRYYLELANGTQAVYKAGYTCKNDACAGVKANELLKKIKIHEEISRLQVKVEKSTIMSAQEVMEHFSAIARGEEKDQFGLDISASDRIKALIEIAKRTVDIDNRAKGKADAEVKITLAWEDNTTTDDEKEE